MEQEFFITGYCRSLDTARRVCAVTEGGVLTEVDCAYPNCPGGTECVIYHRLMQLQDDVAQVPATPEA